MTRYRPRRHKGVAMVLTSTLKSQQAPCGRIVDREQYLDEDREALVTEGLYYACGCRSIRHVYHDGSVSQNVIHHNGAVLVDELFAAE